MTLVFTNSMNVEKKADRVSYDKNYMTLLSVSDVNTLKHLTSMVERRKNSKVPYPEHKCSECPKIFGTSGKLLQHMFVHNGERPFRCLHCEKSFSSKFKLMRHSLIHSNERQYRCTYCERCFHRNDHLKNHLQVHNPNKKIYQCDKCHKEYNSRLSYKKHVAIHAAEAGDLNCKICGKNFETSEEILYHLKVHSGSRTIKNPNEKKFKCDHCERHFFTRKDVKRHLVVHTGRRDFLCQFCPQRFGRKDHLVRHIKKSHNSTVNSQPVILSSTCPITSFTKSFMAANICTTRVTVSDISNASCHFPSSDSPSVNSKVNKATSPKSESASNNVPLEFLQSSLSMSFSQSDMKNVDDIKVERNDGAMVDLPNSMFDISQLLNYSSLGTHSTAPLLNSALQVGIPLAMGNNHQSSMSSPQVINTLPRFSQAFH